MDGSRGGEGKAMERGESRPRNCMTVDKDDDAMISEDDAWLE